MTEQTKTPMTEAEYVTNGGAYCPFCGSRHIEAGSFDVDLATGWQPVECRECRMTWDDVYELVGYQPSGDQGVIGA